MPELLAPLVRNTIFSGNIHHCVQADSTNSIALRGAALASQHPYDTPEGAVFLAEEQLLAFKRAKQRLTPRLP